MPRSKEPSGFQPIQFTPGPQSPPAVTEVDFSTPAPQEPAKKTTSSSSTAKPHTAADHKED